MLEPLGLGVRGGVGGRGLSLGGAGIYCMSISAGNDSKHRLAYG